MQAVDSGIPWTDSEVLAAVHDRGGVAGEQLRKLGIRLQGLQETVGGKLKIIVVTSPLMSDGKTSTAANLAASLARNEGQKVALVDADHRNPRVWSLFKRSPGRGFLDLLMGRASVEAAVVRTAKLPLEVLALPKPSEASMDLLPVERVRSVFKTLRERYDFVVCDAPPLLSVADTSALVRLADGTVLVVRAGITPRHAVARTLESIDRQKLIGFVLNGVVGRAIDPYYYPYRHDGGGGEQPRD